MTFLESIFDAFSRRTRTSSKPSHVIPTTTRNRVLMWAAEVFSNERSGYGSGDYRIQFLDEVHRRFRYRHGELILQADPVDGPTQDLTKFLLKCPGDQFLDFIEDIFKVDCFFHVTLPADQLVAELNAFFRIDKLPYQLTDMVVEEVVTSAGFDRAPRIGRRTVQFPRVIIRDNDVVYTEALAPALALLRRPHFQHANAEFLDALEDFRKGDHGDCLTKTASAFESVLKVICDRKGWSYRPDRDTAKELVKIVVENSTLDAYFTDVLLIVATLRNRLSPAHGAGINPRVVPPHRAQYALNAAASAILLVVDEVGER